MSMPTPKRYQELAAERGVERVASGYLNGQLFHGTSTPGIAEVLPAAQSGAAQNHPDLANPNRAYVTSNEKDAWSYAEQTARERTEKIQGPWRGDPNAAWDYYDSPKSDVQPRVLSVRPEGEALTDPESPGTQFQVERAPVISEDTRGPAGAQRSLFRSINTGGFYDHPQDVTPSERTKPEFWQSRKRAAIAKKKDDEFLASHPRLPGMSELRLDLLNPTEFDRAR